MRLGQLPTLAWTPLRREDALLPILASGHTALMTWISFVLARVVTADRGEKGLFAIAGGM